MSALGQRRTFRHSLDHLVGPQQDRSRQVDSDGFGSLEIEYEFKFRWLLDRQISGLRSLQNLGDEGGRTPINWRCIGTIGHEHTRLGIGLEARHGRKMLSNREFGNLRT
jgi:hypothetical protein